jgi:predicted CoA-binding protein
MPAASRSSIDAFLASKRIAFIGLSHNPKDFSRHLFREFVEHGYDVVPVNPNDVRAIHTCRTSRPPWTPLSL